LPRREEAVRPSLWAVSADGIRIVFGNRKLRTLLLFGLPPPGHSFTPQRLRPSRPKLWPPVERRDRRADDPLGDREAAWPTVGWFGHDPATPMQAPC
jgi:hypothetical protein